LKNWKNGHVSAGFCKKTLNGTVIYNNRFVVAFKRKQPEQ